MAVTEHGRAARTHYRVLERYARASLIECRLDTGRTHQIRVHLASIGCPVTGDFLYGAEHPLLPRRFALHSAFLQLETLSGKRVGLESAPPDVFMLLLSSQP
jgi:23S rRNA pseudouridine1911/1915/1917 synthase